jgi:AraC-like DNA-binding protein
MRRLPTDYELIFVTKGVLEMQIWMKRFSVSAGETLLIRPQEEHWGTKDYGPELSFFWMHFLVQPQQLDLEHQPDSPFAEIATVISQHTIVEKPDSLAELFQHLLDEQRGYHSDQLSKNLLVWLILCETRSTCLADNYVQLNFHHRLTATLTAEHLGCNPQYLSRIYRQAYGNTLTEAIHRTRIAHACHLLLHSNLRVNEIASSCGLDDASYFLQLFKRHKGMTATAYRRLHAPIFVNTE